MKTAIKVLLIVITSSHFLHSQVIIDTLLESGPNPNINLAPSYDHEHDLIYTINTNGTYPFILVYDVNLSITDTLFNTDINRPTARFLTSFSFNAKNYYVCTDLLNPTSRKFSLHKIENGAFTDSIAMDLDTIADAYPYSARELDNNTLEITISYAMAGSPSKTGGLLFLDSNFNFKSYHEFNFSTLPQLQRRINHVMPISDSIWHVYFSDRIATYNPNTKVFISNDTVTALIKNSYQIDNQNYIALGLVSSPVGPLQTSWSQTPGLGFYQVNRQGGIVDTVVFNAYKDTVPSIGFNNYSTEKNNVFFSNSIVYDTNNVFLASRGDYTPFQSSTNREYFFVVKTDLSGNLKWRFTFGGIDNLVSLNGISATKDQGCIIVGSIRRASGIRYAIIIKLGPDGTISNVELDAPQTVISLYPNPVQEKLYYSYLPEAHGTYSLQIIDMQGRPVMEHTLQQEAQHMPVHLNDGFYLYHLKDENGKVMQVGKLKVQN